MNEEIKMKKCTKCGEEKLATTEYFHKNNACKYGLSPVCKECISYISATKNRQADLKSDYKKCVDCGELLLKSEHFSPLKNSLDGYYNVCKECHIKRRRKNCQDGYKRCSKCDRELPASRDYFILEKTCLDGFGSVCLECSGRKFFPSHAPKSWSDEDLKIIKENYKYLTIKEIIPKLSVKRTEKAVLHIATKLGLKKIKSFIDNYEDIKYKMIDDTLYKYCKSCKRYLPCEYDYYPKDSKCRDGYRNVCRECKGELFRMNSNVHMWTQEEKLLLKEKYPHMTNQELINKYFQFVSVGSILHKAAEMNVFKTEETMQRIYDKIGKMHSNRLLNSNKWKYTDNPKYNSQRFGELNPNYKGGVSSLYEELRRNIKQWKLDSVENCNYKCILTNQRFDAIHHLYSFDNIIKDTLTETNLPLYDNISKYSERELKQLINKCLEIHYRHPLGVCLAENIHRKFHMEYSYGNNTEEQFYDFMEKYHNGEYKDLQ